MSQSFCRSGSISRPWLAVGASLAAIAILVLLLARPTWHRQQSDLVLFCAAGLIKPVQQVCDDYKKEYGVTVQIEPAGSGALLSKLRVVRDSADLFLAAEESYIREAQKAGLVAEAIPVARQCVVIAVPQDNPRKISGVADLLRAEARVALPNPELAAVGRAAKRALSAGGQWEAIQARIKASGAKVSLVGTVNEAAQDVKIGAADAAVVWDSTARQFGLGIIEVPVFQRQPAEQVTLGVVAAGRNPTAALHFARYLTARDRGENAFEKYFFQPISDADAWADRPELTLMSGAMLKPAIDDLIKRFEQREGVEINTSYNGCGIHVATMKAMKLGDNKASRFPDAYFSCDVSFMNSVQQWFDAATVISRNDIVLAVAKGNPKHITSIKDLTRRDLKVGLGHPQNSALGALTDDLLKKLDLHAEVYASDRRYPIVHTDAGHMLVNQLRAGALDVIVVYRSNALAHGDNAGNDIQIVDMNLPEAVARQPYAVAKDSQHKYLMRRLLEAILMPESQRRFRDAGFQWIAEGAPQ